MGEPTVIYITGDLHGEIGRLKSDAVKKLKKSDVLIVCGDFGFIWDGSEKEKKELKKIGKLKPQILFIAGCHDNYELLAKYPEVSLYGGKARQISGKLHELLRGEIYTIDDKKIFTFGGGISEDSVMREEGNTWWKEENPTDQEFEYAITNLAEHQNEVDYVITHDTSLSLKQFINMEKGHEEIGNIHAFLNALGKNVNFKAWFFGKYHQDKTIPPRYYAVFQSVIKAPDQDPKRKKKQKVKSE